MLPLLALALLVGLWLLGRGKPSDEAKPDAFDVELAGLELSARPLRYGFSPGETWSVDIRHQLEDAEQAEGLDDLDRLRSRVASRSGIWHFAVEEKTATGWLVRVEPPAEASGSWPSDRHLLWTETGALSWSEASEADEPRSLLMDIAGYWVPGPLTPGGAVRSLPPAGLSPWAQEIQQRLIPEEITIATQRGGFFAIADGNKLQLLASSRQLGRGPLWTGHSETIDRAELRAPEGRLHRYEGRWTRRETIQLRREESTKGHADYFVLTTIRTRD